ncbi:bifunctional phosphopantothenoylcysteine decarboxylase/phosphopantothenate--cysteine ligase CoaBC [Methanosalsum natronophilum]|uniref:Coenzyme A biosynthesis bifunctional protein CoaBC n=1 Tax=Methanosalsum natronophilum TaxID=768733 RepID=A0A424Z582_9EURY|nr:bifunctional phosphopantothenoylcysteine decarboxylase/phosphopantothenate--cysteine ligase CoaBC [Methanosalsum natronophilum]MCS3923033.1 phosphopantothenoylcysteine decarboxylase/phosphopantothenate--cysteine ligase [Methanosalsum natronophilum]RQD92711.1 MAG: bifunctional phosphopantothenoylcysteine decarboxylase/phosphopantothenate--cysteine ligase CoaBC [Methanosalsum natronophilum]
MRFHPTNWIKGNKSNCLEGKTIVIGITGSIAAVRVIELSRELIRHGADVYAVMTKDAEKIIHPEALKYATGNEVISEITGNVEHVEFCGLNGNADLYVIAPATANTISKIACGIDDTPVTTFATTAIGSKIPILIVPAMHEAMYSHPGVIENINKLKSWDITILEPNLEEGIAKIVSNQNILLHAERLIYSKAKFSRKLIITSGPTLEYLDPIRAITTLASGKTGNELAKEAFRRGYEVFLVHKNKLGLNGINEIIVNTSEEMIEAVINELDKGGYDAVISAAAISDFYIESYPKKIKSSNPMEIKMFPSIKLIDKIKKQYPEIFLVAFKAETGIRTEELIDISINRMKESNADMIIANDVINKGMGTNDNEVYIISKDHTIQQVNGSKREIAESIFNCIDTYFNGEYDLFAHD